MKIANILFILALLSISYSIPSDQHQAFLQINSEQDTRTINPEGEIQTQAESQPEAEAEPETGTQPEAQSAVETESQPEEQYSVSENAPAEVFEEEVMTESDPEKANRTEGEVSASTEIQADAQSVSADVSADTTVNTNNGSFLNAGFLALIIAFIF